ncbi:PREDICTED: DNA polymerase [Prunus dulcis]|uniref:PREDICTED: DNA polymerase n=1 Tax=Prunus dulcis TaxID=3755 RepID=A0A5E4FN06_PRUDU|nr:PREDICTED: DNA polymerase [Prunus dulcis]
MKGEMELIEKILETEINIFSSIRDGTALMQHMEDFYYITLLENVRSNYQVAAARAVHCACNIPPVRDIPSLSFLCAGIHLVRAYLQRQWKQILSGRVSLQDFVSAKEVRLGTYRS